MATEATERIPWDDLDSDLKEKYSAPTPRYTSYPTAPEWGDRFGPEDTRAALARADGRSDEPLSLYVHVPYCREKCLFCGCASWLAAEEDDLDRYLDGVAREVEAVASSLPRRRGVSQLHWGGGTPTILDPERLSRLFGMIARSFELTDGAEVAIEVNPVVTSFEQIDTLAELGFNRISLGVQDFTPAVQQAVGRVQSVEVTEELLDRARRSGFEGVNIDLMYGLPRQDPASWRASVEEVIRLGPDRLAVFGYAHVPWMRPHQRELPEAELPDTALRFELNQIAYDLLLDAGYIFIGMDHFARPEDELSRALEGRYLWRNFQGYTVRQAADLIGLGVTGISDVGGAFAQNTPQIQGYLEATRDGGLATYRGHASSKDDRLRRHVITNLMCNLVLDTGAVEGEYGIDFGEVFGEELERLAALERDGIVELDGDRIRVTPRGRIFVRQVGMVFDAYHGKREGDGPRFSRTV